MRFKELLEYKRDITITNLGDKFIQRMRNDGSIAAYFGADVLDLDTEEPLTVDQEQKIRDFVDTKIEQIEQADPTPNKQYTEWLIRRYIDRSILRFEDILSTWADLLHEYHRLKIRRMLPPELMDINRFKTESDLSKLHKEVLEIFYNTDEKEEIQKGDAKEILNNSEVRIIIPQDQDAACYYGQGTQWCTAAKKNNMFDEYHDQGRIFIVMPKNPKYSGEKYQLHFCTGNFMDETDSPVPLDDVGVTGTGMRELFAKYDNCADYALEFFHIDHIRSLVQKFVDELREDKADLIEHGMSSPEAIEKDIDKILSQDVATLAIYLVDALMDFNDSERPMTIGYIFDPLVWEMDDNSDSLKDYVVEIDPYIDLEGNVSLTG